MKVRLVVVSGLPNAKEIALRKFPAMVGRHRECKLRITSKQVSRRHCIIEEREGRLTVRDLESSNGTYVNGKKTDGETALNSGDELEVGTIKFRVEYEPVAPAEQLSEEVTKPTAQEQPPEISFDEESSGLTVKTESVPEESAGEKTVSPTQAAADSFEPVEVADERKLDAPLKASSRQADEEGSPFFSALEDLDLAKNSEQETRGSEPVAPKANGVQETDLPFLSGFGDEAEEEEETAEISPSLDDDAQADLSLPSDSPDESEEEKKPSTSESDEDLPFLDPTEP